MLLTWRSRYGHIEGSRWKATLPANDLLVGVAGGGGAGSAARGSRDIPVDG